MRQGKTPVGAAGSPVRGGGVGLFPKAFAPGTGGVGQDNQPRIWHRGIVGSWTAESGHERPGTPMRTRRDAGPTRQTAQPGGLHGRHAAWFHRSIGYDDAVRDGDHGTWSAGEAVT